VEAREEPESINWLEFIAAFCAEEEGVSRSEIGVHVCE
jgi:hypothetical protein